MREFKFRIVYKHKKTGQISISQIKLGELFPDSLGTWEIIAKCQFTGLKDKNGKEYCEGDIIKNGYGNFEIKFGQFYAYLENGLGGSFYITGFYYSTDVDTPLEEDSGEIIGNIYEDSDLLK